MSTQAEAAARSNPESLFSNDSGYEVLLDAKEATMLRAQWAAADAASKTQAPVPPTAADIAAALIAKGVLVPSDIAPVGP